MEASSKYQNLDDDALLQAYRRSGDNQCLGYLLQRYTMLLLGVGMKYLKDKDEAQDAVQQVFMKAITHLPQGEILNFKGWLYVLMRNYCLQMLRSTTYKTDEQVLANLRDTSDDNRTALLEQEYTLEQMSEALDELNDEQRVSITMFYLKKMSYNEIIEQTGFTFTQVKSYIQNGKRNLRLSIMKKMGHR